MSKYGLSLSRIFSYLDRIGESVQLLENTDKILSIFGRIWIKESPILAFFTSGALIKIFDF